MLVQKEVKNMYIGEYIEETYTLSNTGTSSTDQEVQDYYNGTKGNYGYTPGETMEELQLGPTIN